MLVIGTPWLAVVGLEEMFERLTAESLAGGIFILIHLDGCTRELIISTLADEQR